MLAPLEQVVQHEHSPIIARSVVCTEIHISDELVSHLLSFCFFFQLTLQAKKAAEGAAGVSKNTLEDLTYVGKSTIGDLTKTAKEAATKKGLMKGEQQQQQQYSPPASISSQQSNNSLVAHGGTGKDFFSSFSSEINGLASSTTSIFSDLFGKSENNFGLQFLVKNIYSW